MVAAAREKKPKERFLVGYKKGFLLSSPEGAFSLKINGRVQARGEFESEDTGGNRDETLRFLIPRARLKLSGNLFTKNLSYVFQSDFGKGFVTLKDFFADYRLLKGWLHVRAGQWKRPFSRQQINSSGNLELVDRAITDEAFGAGRDIGFALHNNYEKSPRFEWAIGIFNGTGEKPHFSGSVTVDATTMEGDVGGKFSNVPEKFYPALVIRLGYNHNGIDGYHEADLRGGPFRFSVGASLQMDFDFDDDKSSMVRGELDYAMKVSGFSTTGGVYLATASTDAFSDQDFAAWGFHVQAGYTIAKQYQPVLRYALLNPDGPDNSIQELTAGVSWYVFGHGFKIQADGTVFLQDDPTGMQKNYRARIQLQMAF